MATVGIVSPGAMGAAIGNALVRGGARVVVTVTGRSLRTRAFSHGLVCVPDIDAVVGESAVVLSVVPPGVALVVADAIADAARRTGSGPLVADLNAVAPATMRTIAERLDRAGLAVVDGAISGRPPGHAGTTVIYLAGPHAARIASLDAPGIEFRVVGETVGAASAIKMSTASFYKGQTAILAQALRAARANGVLEFVLDDLGRDYADLVGDAPRILQSIAAKSGRYVAEMEEISASQGAVGLPPELFAALARVYAELSRTEAAKRSPEESDAGATLEDVLESLGTSPG